VALADEPSPLELELELELDPGEDEDPLLSSLPPPQAATVRHKVRANAPAQARRNSCFIDCFIGAP
jgi:hypothetical protein